MNLALSFGGEIFVCAGKDPRSPSLSLSPSLESRHSEEGKLYQAERHVWGCNKNSRCVWLHRARSVLTAALPRAFFAAGQAWSVNKAYPTLSATILGLNFISSESAMLLNYLSFPLLHGGIILKRNEFPFFEELLDSLVREILRLFDTVSFPAPFFSPSLKRQA